MRARTRVAAVAAAATRAAVAVVSEAAARAVVSEAAAAVVVTEDSPAGGVAKATRVAGAEIARRRPVDEDLASPATKAALAARVDRDPGGIAPPAVALPIGRHGHRSGDRTRIVGARRGDGSIVRIGATTATETADAATDPTALDRLRAVPGGPAATERRRVDRRSAAGPVATTGRSTVDLAVGAASAHDRSARRPSVGSARMGERVPVAPAVLRKGDHANPAGSIRIARAQPIVQGSRSDARSATGVVARTAPRSARGPGATSGRRTAIVPCLTSDPPAVAEPAPASRSVGRRSIDASLPPDRSRGRPTSLATTTSWSPVAGRWRKRSSRGAARDACSSCPSAARRSSASCFTRRTSGSRSSRWKAGR